MRDILEILASGEYVSGEKISAELGYEPQVPFATGLAEVVQWYRDNRDWWQPLKERAALSQ